MSLAWAILREGIVGHQQYQGAKGPQRCHNNVRVTTGKLSPMHASWQPASGVIISGSRLVGAIDCDRCAYAPALTMRGLRSLLPNPGTVCGENTTWDGNSIREKPAMVPCLATLGRVMSRRLAAERYTDKTHIYIPASTHDHGRDGTNDSVRPPDLKPSDPSAYCRSEPSRCRRPSCWVCS